MAIHPRPLPSLRWLVIFVLFLSVPVAARAEAPLPENGATQRFVQTEPVAPLQIVTSGEASHYLVKLVTAKGGKPVLSVFVRAGDKVSLKVPLGSYRVKYAAGTAWQGESALFGEATQYFEAEKRFDFVRKGGKTKGFEIELVARPDGDLSTRSIGKADW